jgi:hypothetical protein
MGLQGTLAPSARLYDLSRAEIANLRRAAGGHIQAARPSNEAMLAYPLLASTIIDVASSMKGTVFAMSQSAFLRTCDCHGPDQRRRDGRHGTGQEPRQRIRIADPDRDCSRLSTYVSPRCRKPVLSVFRLDAPIGNKVARAFMHLAVALPLTIILPEAQATPSNGVSRVVHTMHTVAAQRPRSGILCQPRSSSQVDEPKEK